jgi:hypothetical protein
MQASNVKYVNLVWRAFPTRKPLGDQAILILSHPRSRRFFRVGLAPDHPDALRVLVPEHSDVEAREHAGQCPLRARPDGKPGWFTVTHGHMRARRLTCIHADQRALPGAFQAGHAGSIPVIRSRHPLSWILAG